ncbi:hypothetical protein K1719_045868 [Acacia pycnantha]|nr:hypothetical protein K1719_045868 [Acacia pycnantha]
MAGRRSESHPPLSGRRREGGYEHDLSPKQREVLAAICDAFLPPITHHEVPSISPAIRSFYAPPENSVDWRWPFGHKFSELSVEKREKILQNWSRENRQLPLRLTFVVLKICFFFNFFSRNTAGCLDPLIYAVVGDISIEALVIGCRVIAVTQMSSFDYGVGQPFNLSYRDVHRHLQVFGFELSWEFQYYCRYIYTATHLHFQLINLSMSKIIYYFNQEFDMF